MSQASLIMTHGLPGSGKSTWAEEQVKKDARNRVRVNRDDIREMLFGAEYHSSSPRKANEAQVSSVQKELIKKALSEGKTVYCDDTNLNAHTVKNLYALAKDHKATVGHKYFNVPIEECQRRNEQRGAAGGRYVPKEVIYRMASNGYSSDGQIKEFIVGSNGMVFGVARETPGGRIIDFFNDDGDHLYPTKSKGVVFVDVDGTLAKNHHEANKAFGSGGKKNFDYFFRSIENAEANSQVVDLANKMYEEEGLNVFVLTGRSDQYANELVSFVKRSGIHASRIIAKRDGDFRPDVDFKKEAIRKVIDEGFIPVHSIDDRARSIEVYESMGILVSRVEEHIPEHPDTAPEFYPEPTVTTIYGTGRCIRCGARLSSGKNIGPTCAKKQFI